MSDRVEAESGQYLERRRKALFKAITLMEGWMEEPGGDGIVITQLTITPPNERRTDYQARIKGRGENGALFIDFCNGNTLQELHENIAKKGAERGFTWRTDLPYEMREQRQQK